MTLQLIDEDISIFCIMSDEIMGFRVEGFGFFVLLILSDGRCVEIKVLRGNILKVHDQGYSV